MIKILIVDDSETETAILKQIFEAEKDMQVVACAKNGEEAIQLTAQLKPDLITMDIIMPKMNGFEATRLIMSTHPTPIVVISSAANDEALNTTFKALEAGALTVLEKPDSYTSLSRYSARQKIIDTVRSMSEIKPIKRRFHTPKQKIISNTFEEKKRGEFEIIAIGVSVGGPQVLRTILSALPKYFPVPIVIVQHMAHGFMNGFTKWLDNYCQLSVKEAANQEELLPGTIYFAPDYYHLQIKRSQKKLIANLVKSPPISGFCPSATVLLQSVANVSKEKALGILLTGMGNDGAIGLLELKKAKGHTIIQDEESAVVFGMAGVAQSLNAVDKVIPLEKIADYLINITKSS